MQVDQLVSRYLAMDLPEHSARQRFFTHSIAPLQLLYQRRRPERSVAYQVVQQNLEMWLALRSVDWSGPGAGVVRRGVWSAKSVLHALCIFRLLRASYLCEHQT